MHKKLLAFLLLFTTLAIQAQEATVKIARLKYDGGGDWYVGPTSLPNLIAFTNEYLNTGLHPEEFVVEAGSPEIFNYPFVFMTGHGNVRFSEQAAQNLNQYLTNGGFLLINDSYGMRPYVEREMKKVFPDKEWVELPFDHPIYDQKFKFPKGIPKIHEHDDKPPQAFGLFHEGRLVCFFAYESDIGDGWEDASVHGDPEELRQKALKMGANILQYVFTAIP